MSTMPSVETVLAWALEAQRSLTHARVALNSANVFPVPDSDTGTNMLLTIRQGLDELRHTDCDDDVVRALRAVARGAVIGARGNSGVIVAEYLRGFVRGVLSTNLPDGAADEPVVMSQITVSALAAGLSTAAIAAERAVGCPAPGTILSTAAAVASAARTHLLENPGTDLVGVLETVLVAARQAVARGTDQLAVLQRASVVDSGAVGLVLILQALLDVLHGTQGNPLPPVDLNAQTWRDEQNILAANSASHGGPHEHSEVVDPANKFEVMCLARPPRSSGSAPTDDQVRAGLQDLGESVVVIGSETVDPASRGELRIHIHASDPAAVLRYFGGWQLAYVVVHQVQDPFPDRAWSWVGITRSPGLLEEIATAGGIALFAQSGTAHDHELVRALTDAKRDEVIVIHGDVAAQASETAWQERLVTAAGESGKRLQIVTTDPAYFTDVHLATLSAHIQMNSNRDIEGATDALRQACEALTVTDGSASSLQAALAVDADVVTVVHDDDVTDERLSTIQKIADQHGIESIMLGSGLAGHRLSAGVETAV